MSSSQQQKENKQNSRQEEDSKDQQEIQQINQNHSKQNQSQIQQKIPQIKVLRFQTQNYEYQFYLKNQIIKIEVDLLENNQISKKYLEGYVKNQRFANITNPCFQNTRQAIKHIEDMYDQSNRQFLQEKFKIQIFPEPIIQKNQKFDAKMTIKVQKKLNGNNIRRQIIFNLCEKILNSQAERDKRIKQKGALTIQMLKIKQEKQKNQYEKKIKQSEEKHNTMLKQLLVNMVGTKRITQQEAKKFKKNEDQSEQQSKQEEKNFRKRQNQSSCVQISRMNDKNQDFINGTNQEQEKRSIYDYRSQIFQSMNFQSNMLQKPQKKIRQQQFQQIQVKENNKSKKKKKKDQKEKKKNRIPLQSKLQQLAQISYFVNDSVDNNGNLSQKQKEIDNYIEKLKKMHLQQFSQEYVSQKKKKKQSSSSSSQSSDGQKQLVYDSTLVAQLKKQLQEQLQQQKNSRRKKKKNKKDKKIKKDRKKKKHKHKSKKHKKKIYDSSTSEDEEQIMKRKMEVSQVPSVGSNFFKYLSQDLQQSNNINNHLAPVQSYQFSDYHTPVAGLHQQSSDLRPLRPIRSKKSTASDAPSMNPIYRPNNSIFAKPSKPTQEGQSQFIQIIKIPIQFMRDIAPYSNFQFSGNRVTKRGGYGCQQVIINFPIPRIGRYSISATVIQSRKLYFWFGVIDIRQRDRTQTYTYANSICFSFRTGVIVANRKWQRQRTGRLKIGQTVRMQIDMSNYSVSWHVNDGKVAIVQMPKKMRKMILVPYFQIMQIGDIIEFS